VACGKGLGTSRPTVRAEISPIQVRPGPSIMANFHASSANKVRTESPTYWPVVGVARELPMQPWSRERQSRIRELLDDCLKNHTRYTYNTSVLPTRAIDVGSDTEEPYLHIADGEEAIYATLSHCWVVPAQLLPLQLCLRTEGPKLRAVFQNVVRLRANRE
jgi:hypothetical protein